MFLVLKVKTTIPIGTHVVTDIRKGGCFINNYPVFLNLSGYETSVKRLIDFGSLVTTDVSEI